jgi:hypothetical protein
MQPADGERRRVLLCPNCGHTTTVELGPLEAEEFDYRSNLAKLGRSRIRDRGLVAAARAEV